MSDGTAIEWTDASWNPVTGCTKVSPGCHSAYCYIERTPAFRINHRKFEAGKTDLQLHEGRLEQPLHWRRPRRVFVNSLSDLFHEAIPDDYLDRIFTVMGIAQEHTFQVLTKRPERMLRYITGHQGKGWPLPNVWLGVTVENQHFADERIPILLETPAAVRFLSCEPLLGPIYLDNWLTRRCRNCGGRFGGDYPFQGHLKRQCYEDEVAPALDWVIVGGESHGPKERSLVERWREGYGPDAAWETVPKANTHVWVQRLRNQCVTAAVPFFFKQWGGARPTSGGRELDGRTWDEYPS